MRIGTDGSYLRWATQGLGRYLDGLLHALEVELPAASELVVYYNSLAREPLFGKRVREIRLRMPKATAFNQVGIPLAVRAHGCDVYLGGANVVPAWGSVPSVVVIHDCKAFREPDVDPPGVVRYHRRWMRASVERAARIVVNSDFTARECETWLGVPRERVRVVYPGIDPRFRPATGDDLTTDAARLRVVGVTPPYVLQVGAFQRHKRGDIAAAAIAALRSEGLPVTLVRCGHPGPEPTRDGCRDLGHVDDATLVSLYRGAAALCMPSAHEGFGLPVIEAMACGTPVVSASGTALPEAAGSAALTIEPDDVAALRAALAIVLDDPAEAARLRDAGRERARQFDWAAAAAAVYEELDLAITGGGPW